jgi:uncharacterized protein YfaP (DUF2135 family)
MNKDAFFATLIGLGIGLLLTGIILVGPNLVKSFPKITLPTSWKISLPQIAWPQKKATATPTPGVTETQHTVTIDSPLADAIESTDSVLVSGSTSKESKVVISGLVDDVVIMTNGDGKFAGKVTLTEGKNDIVVTSYHGTQSAKQKVTVYYTPEEW